MRKTLIGTGLLTLLLAGCWSSVPSSVIDTTSSSSSAAASAQWVSFEGTIQKLGVSMFMEGTHKLVTDNGETALLESDTVVLDDYVDARVRLTGLARATTEGQSLIVNVDGIERVLTDQQPSVLEESPTSSSEMSSSSSMSSVLSSVAPSSSSKPSSSAMPLPSSSSVAPAPVSSSSLSSSSLAQAVSSSSALPDNAVVSSSSSPNQTASIETMAKAKVDAANFSQQYCTGHIGFCIPVHRNWFFVSFGANVASSLWHVELSDKEINEAGQGGISIDLVSGALAGQAEGVAVDVGGKLVAYRQWTGNRHFEVSGPAALKAALEYIAQNLSTSEQ